MGLRGVAVAVLAAWSAAALGQAAAQGSQAAGLKADLEKLGAAAKSLEDDLPSFACRETALSQVIKKNKVKQQVQFSGDLRVERGRDGRLHEQLEVTERNGKPFRRGSFEPPFMVQGGFGQALFFFLPATQPCFEYTLSEAGQQGRIDFVSPPGTFDRAQCKETGAPRGYALLDAEGGVKYLERQVPGEFARQVHVVDSASIDFVPAELGGTVYPLPAKMTADVPKEGGVRLHFEAEYAGCHLFKATSRILPGETVVPDETGPEP